MPEKPKQKRTYVRKKILPKKVVCEGCGVEYRIKNKSTHEKNLSHKRLTQNKKWNMFFMSN